jgi:hypothetical protein
MTRSIGYYRDMEVMNPELATIADEVPGSRSLSPHELETIWRHYQDGSSWKEAKQVTKNWRVEDGIAYALYSTVTSLEKRVVELESDLWAEAAVSAAFQKLVEKAMKR